MRNTSSRASGARAERSEHHQPERATRATCLRCVSNASVLSTSALLQAARRASVARSRSRRRRRPVCVALATQTCSTRAPRFKRGACARSTHRSAYRSARSARLVCSALALQTNGLSSAYAFQTRAPSERAKTAYWARSRRLRAKGITETLFSNYATRGVREARDLFALRQQRKRALHMRARFRRACHASVLTPTSPSQGEPKARLLR